ncbi:hypothetical protein ABK040_014507 [Willaertia magna]
MSQQNNSSSSTSSSPLTTQSSSFNKEEIEKQIEEWKNKYLNKYICSISQQLMIDPVIIETGHTFERSSIEEWLKSKNTCPITRKKLKVKVPTPNFGLRLTINENIEKYIKKLIKHVKLWTNDINLIDLCSELINESLDLIKNNNNFNNLQNELKLLKFDILLNQNMEEQVLFDKYIKLIKKLLPNLNDKILQLQKLENKLSSEPVLQQYYYELLQLLIELTNDSNNTNLLIEVFTKYCKLNNVDNNLVSKILVCIQDNEMKLNCIILLFNNTNYSRTLLLQQLLNIKIDKFNEEFINFFKDLLKEVNLNDEINLNNLINFIENCNELKDERVIIYKNLYKNNNDIKYLELQYELDKNNKDIELQLLDEYLKLNLIDKYLNLYIKLNEDKLDSFNITFLKYLQNQNKEIIILQNELLSLKEWKNQQILNNFKIKYPKYDYVNIINIETPLNVEKYEEFYSDEFEVFGLKWKICIYPKGDDDSEENECGIYLELNSLQYKNENEEEKEISSIKIKCSIDSINLNDNFNYEYNFTKINGYGNWTFKQSNFIPIIKNDKQIFSIVIGIKKLDIEFK